MSKIVLFDPNCYKFTDDMVEHWEKSGHEVKKSLYYDPALVQWADIIWFETCDNNLAQATKLGEHGWKFSEMDMTNKKVICRVIDIEAWCGLQNNVDWTYVDETIFIAPHIRDLVLRDVDIKSHYLIPCGVNENIYNFVDKPKGKNVAWVSERWYAKGVDLFFQYAAMLYKEDPEYKVYAVGIWADSCRDSWYKAYIDHFIRENPMNVEFIDRVDNMNDFLDNMDYAICFSKKEAFSYAIAEGMCKGCKPIIHNFYGCGWLWDKKYIWNTLDEALVMTLNNEYNRNEYREYVVDNYSLEKMLSSFDELIEKR